MIEPRVSRLVLVCVTLLAACSKKDEPERTSGATSTREVSPSGPLATASAAGELAGRAKGALVLQQCSLACGARPGIDSQTCTQTCAKRCEAEPDVPSIDACAGKVAAESPAL